MKEFKENFKKNRRILILMGINLILLLITLITSTLYRYNKKVYINKTYSDLVGEYIIKDIPKDYKFKLGDRVVLQDVDGNYVLKYYVGEIHPSATKPEILIKSNIGHMMSTYELERYYNSSLDYNTVENLKKLVEIHNDIDYVNSKNNVILLSGIGGFLGDDSKYEGFYDKKDIKFLADRKRSVREILLDPNIIMDLIEKHKSMGINIESLMKEKKEYGKPTKNYIIYKNGILEEFFDENEEYKLDKLKNLDSDEKVKTLYTVSDYEEYIDTPMVIADWQLYEIMELKKQFIKENKGKKSFTKEQKDKLEKLINEIYGETDEKAQAIFRNTIRLKFADMLDTAIDTTSYLNENLPESALEILEFDK